jgi:hypothetical protein
MNRNGVANTNEKLDYIQRIADAQSTFGRYDCDTDWLYNDANSNGDRDFGPTAGFTESDDCYGEVLFYVDDTNGDDQLSVGEQLRALGKSKVRKVLFGDHEYVRGVDLINTPIDTNGHGTSVCSILVAQAAGFNRRFCGIAPQAELVVADRYSFDADTSAEQQANYVEMLLWIEDQGAKVMLWEFGGWVRHFMDGSSHLEALITNRQLIGYSAQVIPNGNLGGYNRHAEADILPSENGARTIEVPNSPTTIFASVLTHANSGTAGFLVDIKKGNAGYATLYPSTQTTIDGHVVSSQYSVSNRGTYRFDVTIVKADGSVVSSDDWTIRVRNNGSNMETFHFYVDDNDSTWGNGAEWTQATDRYNVTWPATADVCVGVASYSTVGGDYTGDVPGVLSPFSGRGPRVDGEFIEAIAAPGDFGDVLCAQTQAINSAGAWGGVRGFGGTSAAGPHVAAAAALLFEAVPYSNAMEVRDALYEGALEDTFTGSVPNDNWGWGKLRVEDAYQALIAARCQMIPASTLLFPANGDSGFDPDQSVTLEWTAETNAQLYDVHFGTTNPPARYVPGLNITNMTIVSSQLLPSTTYYWQIVGRNACGVVTKSEVSSLTTGQAYVPQPDIEVYQQVLVNNQFVRENVPTGGQYDYPAVQIGEQHAIIFAIYNEGDAALELSGTPKIQLTGPGVGDYYVNYTPNENTVAGGNWVPFAVTFKPIFEGMRVVTVRIYTNDPDEAQYSFTLIGQGLPAADQGDPGGGGGEEPSDSDGDGVSDDLDLCPGQDDNLDSDLDGTPDCLDACPQDGAKVDPGTCGCGAVDEDIDNDGIADCNDDNIGGGDDDGAPGDDDPNTPVDGGPVDGDPVDGDPNQPTDVDPIDPGDGDIDEPNVPVVAQPIDPNDAFEGQPVDPDPADPNDLLDLEPIMPVGMCGFGAGFAGMMCMIGFGGHYTRRYLR